MCVYQCIFHCDTARWRSMGSTAPHPVSASELLHFKAASCKVVFPMWRLLQKHTLPVCVVIGSLPCGELLGIFLFIVCCV